MSKSNFGDPRGCLVGKHKPFGKTNQLPSLKKKKLNPSAQDLKIQWEIRFLTLFNMNQNAPIIFLFFILFYGNYIALNEKNAFMFNFGPRKVPQPEIA